ncbi:tetratricopeptide repeat protein [Thermospira aquatica]|uniref:Tetratricopeptide repeat protein n=1 Tax=Thermospira aquatica TaxID=2828656 RepID=A0AAX3BCU3_9SPIR|nr:tetratricopeptide repeat protein [Thermospira aquatica]URA10127.1 hypothetical protein KDW03_11695 [Thermospira aquatica]
MKKFFMVCLSVFFLVNSLSAVSSEVRKYLEEGQQYANQEEFDKAIASFKKCIELDKSFAPPYFNIALLSFWMEDYEQADFYLKEFIKLRDNEPQAYTLAAHIALERKRYDEIEPALQKALALDAENPAILFNAADIWLRMEQGEKAYAMAKKGTSLLSKEEMSSELGQSLWVALLFSAMTTERYDEAMNVSETILRLPLENEQREMVEMYREDIRFFQANKKKPLFIRSYQVATGIFRDQAQRYSDEIAETIYMVTEKSKGTEGKGFLVPLETVAFVLKGSKVIGVEEASNMASRSQLQKIFGSMVGTKTIVVEFQTQKNEKGYMIFEPVGQRVLLKAVYSSGGMMLKF